jgi:anti-anti-sigma factor
MTTPPAPVIELVLSGDLDMEQAEDLQRHLTGGIERGCDIVVDLGQVRFIDCVCLGILIRAAQEVHRWTARSVW